MIKIPVSNVFWADNIRAGGEFGKSLSANPGRGVKLWFLGHGVLVEERGKPDLLVPIGNVQSVQAAESLTPEQWGGDGFHEALVEGAKVIAREGGTPDHATDGRGNILVPAGAPKRGPGRPPKV